MQTGILTIFKFVGIVVAGVLGIIASVSETKVNGKITTWGKVSFALVLAGFLTALAAQFAEHHKEIDDARAVAESNKKMLEGIRTDIDTSSQSLQQIQRAVSRFDSISGGVWLKLPFTDETFRNYRASLTAAIATFLLKPAKERESDRTMYVSRAASDSLDPEAITVPHESPLAPDQKTYPELTHYLTTLNIDVAIFRHPIDPRTYEPNSWHREPGKDPDLSFSISARDPELQYELATKILEFEDQRMQSDRQFWRSSGDVASIQDLLGSQLIIHLSMPFGVSGHPEMGAIARALQQETEINTVILKFGDRELWIRKDKLHETRAANGTRIWVTQFPDSPADFMAATR